MLIILSLYLYLTEIILFIVLNSCWMLYHFIQVFNMIKMTNDSNDEYHEPLIRCSGGGAGALGHGCRLAMREAFKNHSRGAGDWACSRRTCFACYLFHSWRRSARWPWRAPSWWPWRAPSSIQRQQMLAEISGFLIHGAATAESCCVAHANARFGIWGRLLMCVRVDFCIEKTIFIA